MPLLYWAAAGLARWGKYAPFAKKVAARSKIRLYWDRVQEIDPMYFYGGAYRFFGGYYALVPPITGEQDVNKSREMFEKAVAAAHITLRRKFCMRRLMRRTKRCGIGTFSGAFCRR